MAARTPDDTRQQIADAVAAGRSINSVAREFGVDPSTASRICRALGVDCIIAAKKRATEAKTDYNLAARLDLLNLAFDVVKGQLELKYRDPSDVRHLVMALAVLIDKRRLEDGEVTDRTEQHVSSDSARDRIAGRVDELAARRRTRDDSAEHTG